MRRLLRNFLIQAPRDRTIDIVAQDQDGNVILGIVDMADWGSVEKKPNLQKRFNLCVEFLDSGQLQKEFPSAEGKQVTIRLYYRELPDQEGSRFLKAVS